MNRRALLRLIGPAPVAVAAGPLLGKKTAAPLYPLGTRRSNWVYVQYAGRMKGLDGKRHSQMVIHEKPTGVFVAAMPGVEGKWFQLKRWVA